MLSHKNPSGTETNKLLNLLLVMTNAVYGLRHSSSAVGVARAAAATVSVVRIT